MNNISVELDGLEKHISETYTGQATQMTSEVISKLRKHVELLESCYKSTEQFVEYTGDTMRAWDEKSGQ